MKVLRLVLPLGSAEYTVRQIGKLLGAHLDLTRIVDVPLRTTEQITAARKFEAGFFVRLVGDQEMPGFRSILVRDSATSVFDASVVDIPDSDAGIVRKSLEDDSSKVKVRPLFEPDQHWIDRHGRHVQLAERLTKRRDAIQGEPRVEWTAYLIGGVSTVLLVDEADLVILLDGDS